MLFDPVFEDCCAPVNLPNLKRYTPPPCEIEHLPFIDAVVISHNHYDHLSHPTTLRIVKKHPNAHFFVPLGNKQWFQKCGVTNVTELDWWDAREVKFELVTAKTVSEETKATDARTSISVSKSNSLDDHAQAEHPAILTATIQCLPCQHTTARTPFDKNHTLWASWGLSSGGSKVYFGGDTGYRSVPKLPPGTTTYSSELINSLPFCPAFREIGKHAGPFDLAFIPIGAYGPRYIFSMMHANPDDSVSIFLDVKARRALGMHWGTWVLTEEDVLEPPRELKRALKENGIDETGVFDVLDIGESREFESGG